jgi:hypothetical protein
MRALRLIFVFHYFLLGVSFVFSQNSEDSNNQELSDEEGEYSAGSEGGGVEPQTSSGNPQLTYPNVGTDTMLGISPSDSSQASPKLKGAKKSAVQPKKKPINAVKAIKVRPMLSRAAPPPKPPLSDTNQDAKDRQRLNELGLTSEQVKRYNRLSGNAQQQILTEPQKVILRLLGMDGFERTEADIFFTHDSELQGLLLSLSDDDQVVVRLLDPQVDGVLLKESLKKIQGSGEVNVRKPESDPPSMNPRNPTNTRAQLLAERLRLRNDDSIMSELLEFSDGSLDDDWLRVGEIAEVLTRDLEIFNFGNIESFTAEEVWSNPFFPEIANVYDQLELDGLVHGADKILGGNNLDLILHENANAFSRHFSEGIEEIVLMSGGTLNFMGDVSFRSSQSEDTRVVIMSSGSYLNKPGVTIKSATKDLVLASRENLTLSQINLEAVERVAIRGMRDVDLNQVHLKADLLATIKAKRDLNVQGLTFNQDISRILMEAQTMRLRDVHFPGLAQVRLNSLKGAIDGRYPNFGNVSAAQQIGRVNFIQNVTSGGNLLKDRPSFDLHGKNIEIGKIARP